MPIAPAISLNRFTEIESVTITSSAAAPISRAILAAVRCGAVYQPASFHERISPCAHSRSIASRIRAATARGMAPSELPSR